MADAEKPDTSVDAQVNAAEVETEKVVTGAEPSETTDAKPDAAETKSGTPDKALQKMQMQLGTALREIAVLTEKSKAGGLTDADKAKLQKQQERLATIRKFASRENRDDVADPIVDPLTDHVLDLTERVGEQDSLKQQLADANARLASLENDRNWAVAKAKFSGLDVDAIWEKAQTDADEVLGDAATPAAKNRLASKWFEERCEAAKKRQKDEADPKLKAKGGVPSSPSTYKVGSSPRTAPVLSEDEAVLAEARSLVREI